VVRKERAIELNAPYDSVAIGWKTYELVRLVYFASTTGSEVCCGDGRPSRRGDRAASVLTTVTSQETALHCRISKIGRPAYRGIIIIICRKNLLNHIFLYLKISVKIL